MSLNQRCTTEPDPHFYEPDNPTVALDSDRNCDFLLFPDQDQDSILDDNQ